MRWAIVCDFDGTIAVEDVTDSVLARFADPAWREIENDWKAGLIGSRECMARQVDLLRCERSELDAHIDAVRIDPAFPAFVSFCRRKGVSLRVVSDGLDYVILRVLRRHGIHNLPVVANRLDMLPGGRYRLGFPNALGACVAASGTCKCSTMSAGPGHDIRVRPRHLLIGDGASDFCAATGADLVFAKDRLLAHCEQRNLPHVAFADFGEARRLFAALLDIPAKIAEPLAGDGERAALGFGD
ncbi:MAG TPA: MtnX-like HAD-IB family phosphatase [Candidatus Cybelea sp.]|nr:MtnX-like HAD-IB family phosphatase [Candidatus Cybelea sp.]